ncbi:MAG: hypothetical protein JXB03_01255, partial [Spirochaetales bacterium]|nr:hypothetical protein [Spirochaetales bacterium]
MNPVSGVIQSHLHKRSAVFVFPSQLSASFWIRKVLADGLADAVEKRRFISWDKFKEQAFTLNQERTPANRLTRIMFVEGELKTQGEAPLYTRLLPDAFPHALPRFKKDLVRLLPDLHSLVETLNDRDWEIARDVRLLHSRYTAFLEARGLFEPSSMMPEPLRGGDHYIVLFPELIEDYGVFSRAVSLSGYMETVSMDASATALPVMHEFGSQKNEFRWLFQSIRQRYEAGTPFSEMAVSVPCLDEIEDYLVQYARLYDVPLHVRRGRPLSCYPSQHVWRALADCAGAEFSFTEVKNLLLHMGTPFARRHELHALVRALKTHSCAGNW